jgi:hypothetical protein
VSPPVRVAARLRPTRLRPATALATRRCAPPPLKPSATAHPRQGIHAVTPTPTWSPSTNHRAAVVLPTRFRTAVVVRSRRAVSASVPDDDSVPTGDELPLGEVRWPNGSPDQPPHREPAVKATIAKAGWYEEVNLLPGRATGYAWLLLQTAVAPFNARRALGGLTSHRADVHTGSKRRAEWASGEEQGADDDWGSTGTPQGARGTSGWGAQVIMGVLGSATVAFLVLARAGGCVGAPTSPLALRSRLTSIPPCPLLSWPCPPSTRKGGDGDHEAGGFRTLVPATGRHTPYG